MNLEKVRKERESIQYGYSPIEGEAVFLEFDEVCFFLCGGGREKSEKSWC